MRDPVLDPARVASCEGEEYWTFEGKRALPAAANAAATATATAAAASDDGTVSDYGDWRIGPNPVGAPTEREVQNTALGLPVYRALFRKKSTGASSSTSSSS